MVFLKNTKDSGYAELLKKLICKNWGIVLLMISIQNAGM